MSELSKLAVLSMTILFMMLSLIACRGESDSKTSSNSDTASENSNNAENINSGLSPEILEALEWKSNLEFFFTFDATQYQITAYKAVMAWIRNDKEELTKYLTSPEIDVGLWEDKGDWTDDIEYMIFKFPNPNVAIKNGVYPASYQLARKGMDSAFYIDMELIKTDKGWKVDSFVVQG